MINSENILDKMERKIDVAMEELLQQEVIGQFFAFSDLSDHLRDVSRPFAFLAAELIGNLPQNSERTVALRKLLEAKDAAVRARICKQ